VTPVEWVLTTRPDGTTFVTLTNHGFHGNGNEIVKQAYSSWAHDKGVPPTLTLCRVSHVAMEPHHSAA
jgi:hypothetical protein